MVKSMLDHSPIDDLFRALAEPARRAIVERLGLGPASVSTLAAPLPMSLAAVVQHVQVLEEAGIVRTEKTGRVRMCRLEPVALEAVAGWVAARKALSEQRLDRLGAFLAGQDAQAAGSDPSPDSFEDRTKNK